MSKEKYHLFWTGPFSQWNNSEFVVDGQKYVTAEQYMMHKKALLFNDKNTADKIIKSDSPATQKSLGRKVKGFDEKIWRKHREQIVYDGNYAKFSQNEYLLKELLDTGDKILVEASPVDKIWGIGLAEENKDAYNPVKWRGLNLLGKVLTQVKHDLKNRKI